MCMMKTPDIPEPRVPQATQAAKAPVRAWTADPANQRPSALTRSPATARPSTTASGTILGR